MGIYLNPDHIDFLEALNSEIYVDKTGLIELTNKVIRTEQKYVCVSRPRRFGKSMAANMLAAYYSRGCDSKEIFSDYKISASGSFEKHLNKYNVIRLNMAEFSSVKDMSSAPEEVEKELLFDLTEEFSDIRFFDRSQLVRTLKDVYGKTKIPFIFIIDEWDCIFREHKNDTEAQTLYLDFLRNLLKNQNYVALAYMTGMLPIKKYGIHSALNMFTEVSMTDPREYAEFTGFTEGEVKKLCEKYHMPFEEVKRWYDGYNLMGALVYNPRSVVMSLTGGYFNNYWTAMETYEALKAYIAMDFDGLNQKVTRLIAGEGFADLVFLPRKGIDLPALMMTARTEDYDKILGLELGADDYITKPYNPLEVMARVKAQLRRCYDYQEQKCQEETIKVFGLELNLAECMLKKEGREIALTKTEFKILELLMRSPGRIYTKQQIFDYSWEEPYMGDDGTISSLDLVYHFGGWVEELDRDYRVVKVYGEKQTEEQVELPLQAEGEFVEIGQAFNRMTEQLHLQKAERVNTMSEDLFTMLKMESADYQLELKPVDLAELSRRICGEYYAEIVEAGFTFEIDISEEQVFVRADEKLLARVIGNLLTNAKKHNGTGEEISTDVQNVMFRAFVRGERGWNVFELEF
ncbi:MAG: AAA family ATPase [Roseburia sp.]|nr:AAA family ATPase [Roseburia sp.]